MSNNKTLKLFNDFCSKISSVYQQDTSITSIVDNVMKLQDNEKNILISNLYQKFSLVPNSEQLLQNKKVKLFSSKEEETYALSISLFGESLPLKKIFNNLEGEDKKFLWISLKVLIEYSKPKKPAKVNNSILNMEVDENVNGMIEDIMKEFKNNMESGKQTNPMETILGITSNITNKYHDKIQSGEIQLGGLIDDLQNKMPGVKDMMDKMIPKEKKKEKKDKIIIDENFSTVTVPVGLDKPEDNSVNLTKMLPMLSGGLGDMGGMLGGEMGDIFKMIQNKDQLKNTDPKKLQEMKQKMDKIMKDKFNINVNELEKQLNKKDL